MICNMKICIDTSPYIVLIRNTIKCNYNVLKQHERKANYNYITVYRIIFVLLSMQCKRFHSFPSSTPTLTHTCKPPIPFIKLFFYPNYDHTHTYTHTHPHGIYCCYNHYHNYYLSIGRKGSWKK